MKKSADTSKTAERRIGLVPWLLAGLLASFLLLSAEITGSVVGSKGLRDLDTCWILASGRAIVETQRILHTDPFSYTFQSLNRPFVMHQWLSEVIFYCVYRLAGLAGLIYFCTFVITSAFTFIPLYATTWLKKSYAKALIVIALAPLSTLVRLIARPELLAFACLASWLILLEQLRRRNEPSAPNSPLSAKSPLPPKSQLESKSSIAKQSPRWRLIVGFGLLMVLWTNLHSSFVLGFFLLLYFVAENIILYYMEKKSGSATNRFDLTALIALGITACATLCNPYGLGLLTYVNSLINSPLKLYISEMMPIAPENFAIPLLWPFLALLLLCMAIVVQALSEENASIDKVGQYKKISSALLMVAMVFFAFSCRRYVSFCVLTLTYLIASFYEVSAKGSLTADIDLCLVRMGIRRVAASALIFGAAFVGAGLAITESPLTLPPQAADFMPPFAALKFIDARTPGGNLLNDPEYGSMLTWHSPRGPKVFIDTRFDMYGFDFLQRYSEALQGHGYETLFDQYNISWLFLKPGTPLIDVLSREKRWRETYRDNTAVVMERR